MMARLSNVLSQSQSRSVCKTAFDRSFTNCDLVSSFQWHFCSNFVCIGCYVRLPSLHDLYDHIEEAHVGPNGPMSWPPKVQHSLTEFVGSRANSLSPNDSPPSCFMLFQTAYSTPQPTSDFSSNEDTFQLDYFTTCDADNLPHCPPLRHPLSRFERPCTRPSSPYVPPLVEPIHCHAATSGTGAGPGSGVTV
ncbi:hypothetical protein BT96DRAFT_714497 [Gymnopus androsaceus JB14]|uniref:C2H2-type domain-containing protein n=1 Tax=Gymnopus androsaceus JB14 TaxID=1447944 RepID=A0A6A4HJ91_9AGAR|nr:hypothetical protein BT96DRAFT_714497 [Gymnopus androsaceus JB14]